MLPRTLLVFGLLIAAGRALNAQADGCRGAFDALNRVKEQIVPAISPDTPPGKERLLQMSSTLARASANCRDASELWFYRAVVAKRLGQQKDADYYQTKISDLEFEHHYDPFSVPPAAAAPPAAAPSATPEVKGVGVPARKKWALVVGIDQFESPLIGRLNYAVKDSRDFVKFLEDPAGGHYPADHILHLENGAATLRGIKEALGKLRVEAHPEDLIVIYFASHGSPRQSDPDGVSYVMVNDSNPENAATLYSSSLQMIDLVQMVNRDLSAHQVVLVLDTCYSGGAIVGGNAAASASSRGIAILPAAPPVDAAASVSFSPSFNNLKLGYGRAVITASRADEPSWESPKIGNGYFTHYLIEVLREGHANDSIDRVFPLVRTRVSAHVREDQNASQNPTFLFSEHAEDIVLGAPDGD